MFQHQGLHFAVMCSAPELSLQKSPADLHFGAVGGQAAISRAANDPAALPVDDGKRSARFHRPIKELLEDVFLVTVALRMLLPDQWVARCREYRVKVIRS